MKTYLFRGFKACECLATWLPVFEQELKDRGLIKFSIDITQLIGGYSKSAGTHEGGGAADLKQYSTEVLKVARQMGAAMWHRTPPSFTHHGHLVLAGCPHATPVAQRQVTSCNGGGNGLANNRPDDGPRDGVQFPLRTWKQGIKWAEKKQKARRSATGKATAKVTKRPISRSVVLAQAQTTKPRKHASVRRVQAALNAVAGEQLLVDGIWGPATRAAYKRWQRANNLEGHGLPREKSLSLLVKRHGRYRLVK